MDGGSKIESGLQLFSRLNQRPTINKLHSTLFYEGGPYPNEYVEITGDSNTGKTLLITDLLARCILPQEYKGIVFPGQNCGAIIINTNHHFDMFKLISVMEALIKENCHQSRALSLPNVESIIKSSLNKLIVLNCYDSQQLYMTFLNLEMILSNNDDIGLIVLDSISTYYWEYRNLNGAISGLEYHTKVLKALDNSIKNLNITAIFTKIDIDVKIPKEIDVQYQSYKIVIKELRDKFLVDVICNINKIHKMLYCIFDGLLKFIES